MVLFSDSYLNVVRDHSNARSSSSRLVLLVISALIRIIRSPLRRGSWLLMGSHCSLRSMQKDLVHPVIIIDTTALITKANCVRINSLCISQLQT